MAGTIDGQQYAFVHIKVTFPFGLTTLLESIEYDDEDGGEAVTDMRGLPRVMCRESTRALARRKWPSRRPIDSKWPPHHPGASMRWVHAGNSFLRQLWLQPGADRGSTRG